LPSIGRIRLNPRAGSIAFKAASMEPTPADANRRSREIRFETVRHRFVFRVSPDSEAGKQKHSPAVSAGIADRIA
jgi:hypothetical protein